MERKTYLVPKTDIYTLEGGMLLDGYSENRDGAPTVNDTELDANQGAFFDETSSAKGLWDD